MTPWDNLVRRGSKAAGHRPRPIDELIFLIFLLTGALALCAFASRPAHGQPSTGAPIDLRVVSGRLTLKTDKVAASTLLERIAQALGARLWISGELNDHVSQWNLRDVPINEAVHEIARPASSVLILDHGGVDSGANAIREIYVFGDSESGLNPITAPSDTQVALIRELASTLNRDPDIHARRDAAAVLGGITTDESARALERGLGDADGGVRVEVVEALGRIGTDEAMRLVGQAALGSSDPEVLTAAIRVLEGSRSERANLMLRAVQSRAQTRSGALP